MKNVESNESYIRTNMKFIFDVNKRPWLILGIALSFNYQDKPSLILGLAFGKVEFVFGIAKT